MFQGCDSISTVEVDYEELVKNGYASLQRLRICFPTDLCKSRDVKPRVIATLHALEGRCTEIAKLPKW